MYMLIALLGLVSAAAPFLFNYATNPAALWTSLIVGGVMIVAAVFEGFAEDKERWEYYMAGALGVGAIIAPFVFRFNTVDTALWTSVIVGLVAVITAGGKLLTGGLE